jgi:AcrR family transcriptional regulator
LLETVNMQKMSATALSGDTPTASAGNEALHFRILETTGQLLARRGPRKLSYVAVAAAAGISRPTLYKYFPTKDDLLLAYAAHEKRRFVRGMATALNGLAGSTRLDRALRFVVEFQRDHPMRGLVATEPTFVLQQLEQDLETMRHPLIPLLKDVAEQTDSATATDLAELVVRTAASYFLIPGDDAQLLRALRQIVGLRDPSLPELIDARGAAFGPDQPEAKRGTRTTTGSGRRIP